MVSDRELDHVALERARRDLERVGSVTAKKEQPILRSDQEFAHAS